MARKKFVDVCNVLTCGGRDIFGVVGGHRPQCSLYCATGHLSKLFSGKKLAPNRNHQQVRRQ